MQLVEEVCHDVLTEPYIYTACDGGETKDVSLSIIAWMYCTLPLTHRAVTTPPYFNVFGEKMNKKRASEMYYTPVNTTS